jgi:hypothetical protein
LIKGIWYRSEEGGLFPRLANAASQPYEIANLTAHFAMLASAGYNTIFVTVADDDGYQAAYGGGFPYNPVANPHPELAHALDLLLKLASAVGLQVVINVALSPYHTFIDDTFGNPAGAYDFIHSVVDPSGYYAGAPSFIGDPRIAGWLFGAENRLSTAGLTNVTDVVAAFTKIMSKYYPFLKDVVDYGGKEGQAWCGSYAIAGPDVSTAQAVQLIAALAKLMSGTDMLGFECYMDAPFVERGTYETVKGLLNAVKSAVSIPPAQWLFCEAGCNQADGPGRNLAISEAIEACSDFGMGGVGLWVCDGLSDDNGDMPLDPGQQAYAAYNATFTKVGQLTFPGPPQGWHWQKALIPTAASPIGITNPASYAFGSQFPSGYGSIALAANGYGQAVAQAFQETT